MIFELSEKIKFFLKAYLNMFLFFLFFLLKKYKEFIIL